MYGKDNYKKTIQTYTEQGFLTWKDSLSTT